MKTITITALDKNDMIVTSEEKQGTMILADKVRFMILGSMVLGWDVQNIKIS